MKRSIGIVILLQASLGFAQSAARFSGGACASQGDWVQSALDQSNSVIAALQTLRDDPNCTALTKTLDNTSQLKELSQNNGTSTNGMSGVFRELQAIREYVNPHSSTPAPTQNFREIVNYMVFRKSLDTINDIYIKKGYDSMSESQKQSVDMTSQSLKNFLDRASTVSNVAVATTKGILAALPQNKLCFTNHPNEAGLIFSSVVSSAAALATGGQISNLGELVSSLVNFNRQMNFANILSGVELARYRTSVSCLVESTQEAYCALQDAQDSLNFNRGTTGEETINLDESHGVTDSSMRGLLILLRDVPIVTSWMQKVLFGIDPKLQVEADMKNSNWDSVVSFIKNKNSLSATYRDKRQIYYESTKGQDNDNKAAMVKDIIDTLASQMAGEGAFSKSSTINFFTNSINPERIPFFLLGVELPIDFNTRQNPFENIYLNWTREKSHGLNNPDAVVEAIGDHLNQLIDKASLLSSSYFSSRMIVDSMNLIVEGMNGPAVSPYKALFHIRIYLGNLTTKLQQGMNDPHVAENKANMDAYKAMIPMLNDLILRIDKITSAMSEMAQLKSDNADISENQKASRKAMDTIYEFANMLTSRDSFIGNRLGNAVRMDITDTLWRQEHLSARQEELMKANGQEIVTKLSQYFTRDPILQRLDIAQAYPIHEQNLTAVEELFVRSYWDQILEIDCKIFGGKYCQDQQVVQAPDEGFFSGFVQSVFDTLSFKRIRSWVSSTQTPTEDSENLYNLRAKLCIQTLGFPKYADRFTRFCKGAVLVSEFSDATDKKGLNINYDSVSTQMKSLQSETTAGHLTASRSAGVCALRSYIRRNLVYRMYVELQK